MFAVRKSSYFVRLHRRANASACGFIPLYGSQSVLHTVAPRLQLHQSYFCGDKLWWEPIPLLLPSHPKDKLSFNRYDGFLERKPLINSGTVGRELFFFILAARLSRVWRVCWRRCKKKTKKRPLEARRCGTHCGPYATLFLRN